MRPVRLIVILALAGALLAGCGSSSNGSSGTGTSGTATAPAGAAKTSTAPIGAATYGCKGALAGVGQLRVANAGCAYARGVAASWVAKNACQAPTGASRASCTIGGLRCLGARTDQGIAVSCAQPGRSLSFVTRRG